MSPLASTSLQLCPGSTGRCVQARKSHTIIQAGIITRNILPGRGRHRESWGTAQQMQLMDSEPKWSTTHRFMRFFTMALGPYPSFPIFFSHGWCSAARLGGLKHKHCKAVYWVMARTKCYIGYERKAGQKILIYRLLLKCVCCAWLQTLLHQNGSVSSSSVL